MALSERTTAGESKGKTPAPPVEPCFVYILSCSDGSFYTGCTANLQDREQAHNEGHGAAHTASRRPVRLVYWERQPSWPAARAREAQLKHWSHAKKKTLVDGDVERLHSLARRRT
jgi:putative endonuclease